MADDLDLYKILNVSKDATTAEIKKNYHRLAKEFHPDKNPDSGDKFKEIAFAHEVLIDPDKRRVYDRYGLKGLQEGADGLADDFFAQWFPFMTGNRSGSHTTVQRPIVRPIVVQLDITLEDIYNGNTDKTVEFKRNAFCEQCKGVGGPPEAKKKCKRCKGRGHIVNYSFMDYGFEMTCDECQGQGSTIAEKDRCKDCEGNGLMDENYQLELIIDRGVPHMHKMSFPGVGAIAPDGERGDVIVILMQSPHPTFHRSHNDLIMSPVKIELSQALCGFNHCFTHLDGRQICLKSEPGEVIRPNVVKVVHGEGMPVYDNPEERGDLLLKFKITFPENGFASPEQLKTLEALLPPREPITLPPDGEQVQMVDFVADVTTDGIDPEEAASEAPPFQRVQCQAG